MLFGSVFVSDQNVSNHRHDDGRHLGDQFLRFHAPAIQAYSLGTGRQQLLGIRPKRSQESRPPSQKHHSDQKDLFQPTPCVAQLRTEAHNKRERYVNRVSS
jgi:hypothetical protein